MHRLAPVLLLVAGLLLATSLGAPAAPTHLSAVMPAAPAFLDAQASAVLTEVNAEVAQLRQRVARPADAPVPDRDPFNFGGRPASEVTSPVDAAPIVAPPPPLVLPRLVGIASSGEADATALRAFVAFDDRVREVHVGDTIGPFTVRAVSRTGVNLFHGDRATSHSITIR
jgi:hypothetical protein